MDMKVATTREDCKEVFTTACSLWHKSESHVYVAAKDDKDSDMIWLLAESKKLLIACDDLVASVEEILQLYDLSINTFVAAHKDENCFSDGSESTLERQI